MKARLSTILKYTLSLLIAAALLYFSFRGVKWADFVHGLRGCNWMLVVLSMFCGLSAFAVRGARWRDLLLPLDGKTRWITTFNAVNIGNVSNFAFPFLGEVVRCGIVKKESRERASYSGILGTVALERAWDMLSLLVFLAALLALRWGAFGGFFVEKLWQPTLSRFAGIPAWVFVALLAAVALCAVAIARTARMREILGKMFQGFVSCFRMPKKWLFLAQTLIVWTLYWLQIVLISNALPGMEILNPVDCLFIMLCGSFASFVPVPGGLGAYHYVVALALSGLFGIPWQTGIVFATLAHESQAATMALSGAASAFSILKHKFRKH